MRHSTTSFRLLTIGAIWAAPRPRSRGSRGLPRSELIGDAGARDPLILVARDRDDRRGGEAARHAAILHAGQQREAFAQIARQRISARDANRIFACRRLRSEEHTSGLQSLMRTSYAVFCLNKKKNER